jgi:hypothetical protein
MAARFLPRDQWLGLKQKLCLLPMFPVSYEANEGASLLGG